MGSLWGLLQHLGTASVSRAPAPRPLAGTKRPAPEFCLPRGMTVVVSKCVLMPIRSSNPVRWCKVVLLLDSLSWKTRCSCG